MPFVEVGARLRQTHVLLKKNFLLNVRNLKATVLQLFVPVLFVALLFAFQFVHIAFNSQLPDVRDTPRMSAEHVGRIPRCVVGPLTANRRCYTIGYYPAADSNVQSLVEAVRLEQGIPASEVVAFRNEADANAQLIAQPNTTQGMCGSRAPCVFELILTSYAVEFDYGCGDDERCLAQGGQAPRTAVQGVRYWLQFNQTIAFRRFTPVDAFPVVAVPMAAAMDRALLTLFGNRTAPQYAVSVSEFPHPKQRTVDVVRDAGAYFFFGALMFNFVIQLGKLVMEKERKLRQSMTLMGLKDSVYWFTWFITNLTFNLISSGLLIAAGAAFQFPFFLENSIAVYATLFVLFALAMVSLAFLFATLIHHSRLATSAGFVMFLVGAICQGAAYRIFSPETEEHYQYIFSFLPFALFAHGLDSLAKMSGADAATSGMEWHDIESNAPFPMRRVFNWLALDFIIYLVLALFFDNVIPGNSGRGLPPWYFLDFRYWLGRPMRSRPPARSHDSEELDAKFVDADVEAEQKLVDSSPHGCLSHANGSSAIALMISHLRRVFVKRDWLCRKDRRKTFAAVADLCLTVREGQLLCLLGHNGAGKTTTISMLIGLVKPTAGDAFVYGHSVLDDSSAVQQMMGVCPQHDIQWKELTGAEHIELFAALKRVPRSEVVGEIAARLADVGLSDVGDRVAGAYSGGMRRRLSVAMALTADPKVVYLDEPTTGMDPISRRQVWNLIEKAKRGRAIVLTTHSMEEADVLADKVAIMKAGRLRTLGTCLALKNKHGSGYNVSVMGAPADMPVIKRFVLDYFIASSRGPAPAQAVLSGAMLDSSSLPSSTTTDERTSPVDSSSQPVRGVGGVRVDPDGAPSSTRGLGAVSLSPHAASTPVDSSAHSSMDTMPPPLPAPDLTRDNAPTRPTLSSSPLLVSVFEERPTLATFKVSAQATSALPKFFRHLEHHARRIGLSDFQISMTTLDEVFLRVAHTDETFHKKHTHKPLKRACRPRNLIIAAVLLALLIAGAVLLALFLEKTDPAPPRSPEPSHLPIFDRVVSLDAFPTGVQATDATASDVRVTIRTGEAAPLTVRLLLYYASGTSWWLLSNGSYPVSDGRIQVTLNNLAPDTAYLVLAETTTVRSEPTRFRTALSHRSKPRRIRFGAVSDLGPVNRPFPSLQYAAREKFDFFVLAGNTIYSDEYRTAAQYDQAWIESLAVQGLANISASTSLVGAFHDGDALVNIGLLSTTAPAAYEQILQDGRDAFARALLPLPRNSAKRTLPDAQSLYRRLSWGCALDVFVLDELSTRNYTERTLLGEEQRAWLVSGLVSSNATIKLVVGGLPMTNWSALTNLVKTPPAAVNPDAIMRATLPPSLRRALLQFEGNVTEGVSPRMASQVPTLFTAALPGWDGFEGERLTVLQHIRHTNVTGVVWLSGSAKLGVLSKLSAEGEIGSDMWEVVAGPGGTHRNILRSYLPLLALGPGQSQYPIMLDTWSYTRFELDPLLVTLKIDFVDDVGVTIASRTLDFGGAVESTCNSDDNVVDL